MIELLLFCLLGMLLGAVAGLVPGLHVNTIALLMLPLAFFVQPLSLAAAVISMAIATTFFDFIPSTLLGAPDPETSLSVLPGHRMLMAGRGIEAVYLSMLGGLGATAMLFLLFPLVLLVIPVFYAMVQGYIAWLLLAIAAFAVLSERGFGARCWAFALLLLSGALGCMVLNGPASSEYLFPMFTGLFGFSTLLFSLGKRGKIPQQSLELRPLSRHALLSGITKGIASSALVGTLPALGGAQAAMLTQYASKGDDRGYLISMGAISTITALFSLVSLYTIAKARSGAAVVVGSLLPDFGFAELVMMLGIVLLSAGVSALLLMRTARLFVRMISCFDYAKTTKATMAFLVVLVAAFTGMQGFLILAVSVPIGMLAPLAGVRRSTLMGCLMVPVILFYSGVAI